ncbi:MAG: hypothetical protein RMI93_00655 [Caldimicrobium sp.]|nr:hypothetical protein [Caldimicrobium sp.]MDW8182104.1 hypothetical protein [Caldimicrobium sp.]
MRGIFILSQLESFKKLFLHKFKIFLEGKMGKVAFGLKVIKFHNSFGREAPVEASLVSVELLSSRSGWDF